MMKVCILVVCCVVALTSAAPYNSYYRESSSVSLYDYLYHLNWRNINLNEEANNGFQNNKAYNQNKQGNSEENSSEENSSEDYESSPSDSTSLRGGSLASSDIQPSITDPPIQITNAAFDTTDAPASMRPQIITTEPVQGLPGDMDNATVVVGGDAGNAQEPGVNSPQVNVVTTKSPATPSRKASTEEPQPTPKPTCKASCPLVPLSEIVCGSDGVTYVSRCVFEAVMCRENTPEIVIAHEGECEQKQIEPETSDLKPGSPGGFMP
ncbi:uncharacterized protein LOC117110361 [Anneissia japonica]|uniref:uncharacterized protein LOC117110361 n=1 Tax=Anneissia japonica TaxID=1529436 RepID=UPI001425515A|nr:uncharacterized protein LOC117110361 [Anneissia japonica]